VDGHLIKCTTRGQSDLAKAAPNDPAHTARAAAEMSRVVDGQTDRQTPQSSSGVVCVRCSLIMEHD